MQINYSLDQWDQLAVNWQAWWDHQLTRPMVIIEKCLPNEDLHALRQKHPGCSLYKLGQCVSIAEFLQFYEKHLECTAFYGDSWPRWIPDFGPGIVAGFTGAQVNVNQETVWFEPPADFSSDYSIPKFDETNFWFARVMDVTRQAVQRWQGAINVGFTDLGGNLDVLAAMRGTEQLLMDLYDDPAQVSQWITQITKAWIQSYNEFFSVLSQLQQGFCSWAPLYSTKKMYMLQSDFSYMISPDMFEKFVVPDIVACCDVLDHPFYHLDGRGQLPHLPHLLKIESLRGIQWVTGGISSNQNGGHTKFRSNCRFDTYFAKFDIIDFDTKISS